MIWEKKNTWDIELNNSFKCNLKVFLEDKVLIFNNIIQRIMRRILHLFVVFNKITVLKWVSKFMLFLLWNVECLEFNKDKSYIAITQPLEMKMRISFVSVFHKMQNIFKQAFIEFIRFQWTLVTDSYQCMQYCGKVWGSIG